MIARGAVVVLPEADDQPEWLERVSVLRALCCVVVFPVCFLTRRENTKAFVARLANRQARVVPSEPIETIDIPFSVLSLSGDAVVKVLFLFFFFFFFL